MNAIAAVALVASITGWIASASAATAPFVQLVATPGSAAIEPLTCDPAGPTPRILARFDLGPGGTYRYSPAFVVPYFFDDEGEFNLVWNQDATLLVSEYSRVEGVRTELVPLAPLATWFAAYGRMPDHTELALRVATYDSSGKTVAASRVTWDCTTGVVRAVEHRGNAAGAATLPLVEFYHAGLDHYFVSADAAEIGELDAGVHGGWQRTGEITTVYATAIDATSVVCRFYLPPAFGDSHFYSASATECADVRARFPGFVYESSAVFAVALPDLASGACPAAMVSVFRLWNARSDSNHRYTADAATRDAMLRKGYVAEGYGPTAVAFCALP
jgi:hypothetical protein